MANECLCNSNEYQYMANEYQSEKKNLQMKKIQAWIKYKLESTVFKPLIAKQIKVIFIAVNQVKKSTCTWSSFVNMAKANVPMIQCQWKLTSILS